VRLLGVLANAAMKLESFDLNVRDGYDHVAKPDAEAHGKTG